MITFKQFIREAPTTDATAHELDDNEIKSPGKYDREESVGHTGNHDIRARSWNGKDESERFPAHHYLAVNDNDDKVHMSVRGGNTEDGYLIANETRKHPDSTINAPDFYKEILQSDHAPKGIQSGGSQTPGGMSIWKRLHKDHEVIVTHHDSETNKRIKLHTGDDFHKNYDQDRPTHFRVRLRKK
jgi:hypothetical protein